MSAAARGARAVEHRARLAQLRLAAQPRLGRCPGGLLPGLDAAAGRDARLAAVCAGALERLTQRAKPDPTDTTLMSIRRRLPGYADAAVAVTMLGVLYYLAMRVEIWRDFFNEAGPAVEHLIAGNLHGFLALTPIYGGSLLLSAPALALGGALDGLNGAYRLEVLFCATTIAVLALALARIQRSRGQAGAQPLAFDRPARGQPRLRLGAEIRPSGGTPDDRAVRRRHVARDPRADHDRRDPAGTGGGLQAMGAARAADRPGRDPARAADPSLGPLRLCGAGAVRAAGALQHRPFRDGQQKPCQRGRSSFARSRSGGRCTSITSAIWEVRSTNARRSLSWRATAAP